MIGTELLDDRRADPVAVGHELRDIARLNGLFGGRRAVVRELERFFERGTGDAERERGEPWTLLDIGTGLGDIPRAAARAARRYGIALRLIGIEVNRAAARLAQAYDRTFPLAAILADGGTPPLAPGSVDIVLVSQVLHHLTRAAAVRWLTACNALARRAVVIADLRRSRLAMAGVWATCLALGMDRVTRHDAVLSLRRGYTRPEISEMLAEAGVKAVVRYRRGSRIVASWSPGPRS